jgi:hypothetical protein
MLLGTTHLIRYENNASQRKFIVHELEPSFFIEKLPFPPAQDTNTQPFPTLLLGQLPVTSLVKVSQLPLQLR